LVRGEDVAETTFVELPGHSAAIRSLSVSDDGSRLASAGIDHTIRIWELENRGVARRGTLVKELRGHAGPVYAAVFAPGDSNSVVSTGYDDRLRLWSIDLYREQQLLPGLALRGHVGPVLSARFSPSGESVVTASLDRTARRWNVRTATEQRLFREGHAYLASRAMFYPQSRLLLTAGGDGTVRIWDLDKQAELLVLDRTGYRAAAAIAPDERAILTGSSDVLTSSARPHGAIVWNAKTGERLQELVDAHKAPVTVVAYSPAVDLPAIAFTGDDNGVFQLWNPDTGERLGPRIDEHGSPIVGAAIAADGRSLVTADASGQVFRWDISTSTRIAKVHEFPHQAGVLSMALLPNGCVLTGGADGRLRLFDADGKDPMWTADLLAAKPGMFVSAQEPASEVIPSVAAYWDESKSAAVVVVLGSLRRAAAIGGASEEEFVRLFELDFLQRKFQEVPQAAGDEPYASLIDLRAQGAAGWSTAIAPGGREIVTIGRDEARLWDRDGHELAAFRPHQDLTFAEFSHSGKLIATASLDSSVRIWDADSGQPRMTLDEHTAGPLGGHQRPVNCAVFSPDDQSVWTGSEDGTVRQWNLATMRVDRVITASALGITRLVLAGGGQTLITASRSGEGAIWRLAAQAEPAHRLVGHSGEILDVCLSPDEAWIVTASADNTARIWDARTGGEVLSLAGHASEVTAVAVLADGPGLRVLTGSSDQTAKLWAISGLSGAPGDGSSSASPAAKELISLRGHTRGLTSVAFAPDGSSALTASRDGMTIVWPAAGLSLP
jgi:WD40 repeat protein